MTAAGITVFCDPALKPAMLALDPLSRAASGAPVAVLCAPASAMLAQIQRHTRNDVLFTLNGAMDLAVQGGLVDPRTRIDGFNNKLVLAARILAPTALPPGAVVGVTDNTVISEMDGAAIMAANGISPGRLIGAASTADVVFLLNAGAVDAGLVYLTDVKADAGLKILATLNADPALTSYSGAVNSKAVSPNARNFLNILRGPEGAAALRNAGLEITS
jgi:ABC-type molybdate transport system substrate-binding protein